MKTGVRIVSAMTNTGSTATLTRGLPQQSSGGFTVLLAAVAQMSQSTAALSAGVLARGSFRPGSGEGQNEEASEELQGSDLAQADSASATQTKVAGAGQQPVAQPMPAASMPVATQAQSVIAKLVLPQAMVSSATSAPSRTSSSAGSSISTGSRDQKTQTNTNVVSTAVAPAVVPTLDQAKVAVPVVPVPVTTDQQPVEARSVSSDSRTEATNEISDAAASANAALAANAATASNTVANAVENAAAKAALNAANANAAQNEAAKDRAAPAIPNQPVLSQAQQTTASSTSSQNAAAQQPVATAAPALSQSLTMAAVLPNAVFLPNADAAPGGSGNGDLTALGPRSQNSKTADTTGSKDSVTTNPATNTQGASKGDAVSTNATQGSAQTTQNGNQNQAHTQSDGSSVPIAAVKAGDSATPFVQLQGPTAHQAGAGNSAVSRDSDIAHDAGRADNAAVLPGEGQSVAAGGINTAKLIQTMNETGMQVGMRTAEFGDISIRTSVSQQQMMTQISVDHPDLGQAISAHISAVQTKLGDELGIHATIEVGQSGAGFTGEKSYSSQQEQQQPVNHLVDTDSATAVEGESLSLRAITGPAEDDRLDIRA